MSRLELRPFSEDFVEDAGALLAARHRGHRAAEPLLPPRFEEPAAAAEEVRALVEGATGAVALRDGRLVGLLLGSPRPETAWGEHVWVELAGHAVEEAETLRDLYAAAAAPWVEQGWVRQYAMAPAHDPALLEAWYRLGFGQQQAHGVLEVPAAADWPEDARLAEERDADALLALTPFLPEFQAGSPVFSGVPRESPAADELRAEILEDIANPEIGDLVAERDGRVVGSFQLVPATLSSTHAGLARPEGAVLLGWGVTAPEVRGSGAGLALMQAAFAWARERGHDVILADWRVTNLLSSRFWPARGFRTTFLRLYRHIP